MAGAVQHDELSVVNSVGGQFPFTGWYSDITAADDHQRRRTYPIQAVRKVKIYHGPQSADGSLWHSAGEVLSITQQRSTKWESANQPGRSES